MKPCAASLLGRWIGNGNGSEHAIVAFRRGQATTLHGYLDATRYLPPALELATKPHASGTAAHRQVAVAPGMMSLNDRHQAMGPLAGCETGSPVEVLATGHRAREGEVSKQKV
jgi:hypothetical protein